MIQHGSDQLIALIGPHPPYRGGIAHFTDRVTREFRESGRPVLPVSFRRMYPKLLFPGQSQIEAADQPDEPVFDWIDSLNPRSWSKTAEKMIGRGVTTAVFMYWMPFFAPAFTRIARRLRKADVRVIGIVHNAIPHERHIGDASLTKTFLGACDSVIVLSESVGADVQALSPATRVRTLSHPVYDRFGERIQVAAARAALHLHASAKVLLFFGIVRRYKGLDILLDALPQVIEHVPNAVLVVAGEFYDDPTSYRSQLARLGIEKHVRIVDEYIPTNRVGLYFSAADVVVQPYRTATQSGVVRTAHHFGIPVIATDVGGLASDVGDSGMVVKPEDPSVLAQAIVSYFREGMKPGFEEKAGAQRRAFGWRAFVEAILEEAGDRATHAASGKEEFQKQSG